MDRREKGLQAGKGGIFIQAKPKSTKKNGDEDMKG